MSYVTDVILITDIYDCVSEVENICDGALSLISDSSGGDRSAEVNVYMASINYCDAESTRREFSSIAWGSPETARLMIKTHEDECFSVLKAESC